jgi:hypothetical protein
MTFYLMGGRGRLGRAIAAEYASSELVTLRRSIYEDWPRDGSANQVSRYFDHKVGENSTVFVTSGLLDPNFSEEDLLKVNYTLAKNVIDGASKNLGQGNDFRQGYGGIDQVEKLLCAKQEKNQRVCRKNGKRWEAD